MFTCHTKISKGVLPHQAVVNNLQLEPIPPEFNCMTQTVYEESLDLSACEGPTTCLQGNIPQIISVLPRQENEDHNNVVELKRNCLRGTMKGNMQINSII